MVVTPNELDGAGLGSFLAEFLDKADFGADVQTVERVVKDAVVMEKDLAPIKRREEAVAGLREDLGHAPCGWLS